ncbi:MAG: hypothetical protein WCO16_01330 [bacterium]
MENLVQMASANTKTQEKPTKTQEELRSTLEKKLVNLESTFNEAVSMYEQALENNTFEDADDEDEGSGEKRKQDIQNKILKILERGEVMRARLDGGEELSNSPEFTPESIAEISAFTSDEFGKGKFNEATITPPTEIDYTTLKNTPDASKYGEYTLNPEMGGVDYENAKIFIPDLSAMNGKELDEVFKHVVDTYGDKYHIPGLEYWKYIIENPSKADPAIKDGKYYFFPGSVLRYSGGNACVPYSYWLGSRFDRDADHLGLQWGGDYRVLLLEK